MVRRVESKDKAKELLGFHNKWYNYQRWNAWSEREWDLTENEKYEILKDVFERQYRNERLRPEFFVYDDLHIQVRYPNACVLCSKPRSEYPVENKA